MKPTIYVPDLIMPFDVPDLRVDGIAAIEEIEGWTRLTFYQANRSPCGAVENVAAIHLHGPNSVALGAIRRAASHFRLRLTRELARLN